MPYPAELLNTPSKKQLKPIGESEMGEDELRKKLRVAFDKFDADGSGAVSMQEMGKLVKALKMEVTPAQLKELMKEADPDGSGDINFDEFVAALQRQMKGGGGGLANVFNAAGDAFGWLNPLSWFGAPEPTPAPAPAPSSPAARRAGAGVAKGASSVPTPGPRPPIKAAPSEVPPMSPTRPPISPAMRKGLPPPQNAQFGGGSPKSAPSTPTSPATATGAEHFFIRGKNESPRFVPFPGSARSMGSAVSFNSSLSGRPRTMKVSQLFVARSNHAAAEEVRQQATANSDFDEGRRAYFMGKQQRRIRAFQKQRKDAKRSVEKMKSLKNASMQEMRQGADDRHVKEVKMKARHAASGRKNVLDEKEVQLQSGIDRHEKALKAAEEHRVAHAQHRVQIREQVKELADEKESNAKEAALRVRHETRKEVRQEGWDLFQGFRDATARDEKLKQEEDKDIIALNREKRMAAQKKRIGSIQAMERVRAKAAQSDLVESRKEGAEEVRQIKEAELERKRQFMIRSMEQRRDRYQQEREHVLATTVAVD